MRQYKTGQLAFLDVAYLVPCKVLAVLESGNGLRSLNGKVKVKLTATRGAYKRGEVLEYTADHVIPRKHVFVRSSKYRIQTDFAWVADSKE